MSVKVIHGDMIERLADIEPDSIDSIVTDPPYHLTTGKKGGSGPASVNLESPYGRARVGTGFMGMKWDGGDVAMRPETWAALLRVAKPGAHLLAFSSSRTFHRMWCAVEDAGWEIRDTVLWLYGSGFPKSSNQDDAWDGWGTALKPAFEPIVLARKPFRGNVPDNLAEHGTGALNIDGCRVGSDIVTSSGGTGMDARRFEHGTRPRDYGHSIPPSEHIGRWPANVLHDGSDEVIAAFPDAPGQMSNVTGNEPSTPAKNVYGTYARNAASNLRGDKGSAARFFWCPKASKSDRNEGLEGMPRQAVNWSSGDQSPGTFQSPNTDRQNENFHPTVKPTELMRYLCRLVTPKGGVVLDPFMGSGSTGKAAVREGFSFVGIELDERYIEIAKRRIHSDAPLFAEVT